MNADEDIQCNICQSISFEGEEVFDYKGYSVCILCAISLGM